jgi:ABC-type glycerol-3-phosphate transport system substrate-binding protein
MTSRLVSRRSFLTGAAAAAGGGLLAACAPMATPQVVRETVVVKETVVVQAEPTKAPPGSIDLDFWYIWGGDGGKAMEAVSAEFEKRNPEVKMHPLTIGGVILDKTLAAYAAGAPPDICDLILCAPLAARGALVPIDDFMAVTTVVKEDNYFDAQWDGTKWAGRRWGLPANEGLGWLGLFRNRGLVREAGLDESQLPQTYEELRTWSQAITKVDEKGAIEILGYSPAGMVNYPDCASVVMGVRYFDPDALKYNLTDERFVEYFYKEKLFYDDVGPENLADFRASFSGQAIADPAAAGKVGLWTTGSWGPGYLVHNAAEGLEWGVSFMVDGAGQGAKPFFAGTHTMMMLKGADVEWAWKFLEFSSTDEYIKMVYDISGFIMGTKSFINSLDASTLYPGLEFFIRGLSEGTRVWGLGGDPNWYLLWSEFFNINEAVGFGQTTPEEALANLQKMATEELDKLIGRR